MKRQIAQLGAMFVWYLAKFIIRDVAWMTAEAAMNRIRLRRHAIEEGYRVLPKLPGRVTYDGPAGFRD